MDEFDSVQSLLDEILGSRPMTMPVVVHPVTITVAKEVPQVNSCSPEPKVFSDSEERTEMVGVPATLPIFSSAEIAEVLDIRSFATLVTLNTRRWHAKVKDRQAARDAATASGADEAAFLASKNLLVGADEKLKAIHKAIDSARAKYYEMTLPWTTTAIDDVGRRHGSRLLPNTLFFDFTTEMARCKAEMVAAVDAFEPEYPNLVQQAQSKLGTRFDITEYPNASSIRSQFDLSFDFQPLPAGTDFKGLPDQQVAALSRAIQEKTEKQLENAMQDLWIRLRDAVTRVAERLSHPDNKFQNTLILNVESVAMQLKHLNVTGDTRVEKLRLYVSKHLCGVDADDLRKKPVMRVEVATRAQTVLDMMDNVGRGGHA